MILNAKHLVFLLFFAIAVAFLTPMNIDIAVPEPDEEKPSEPVVNLNQPLPDFKKIRDVKEKKEAFFEFLSPLISYSNQQILKDREFVMAMQAKPKLSAKDKNKLSRIADRYRVPTSNGFDKNFYALMLKRVDTIPPALALAQAANESAWGTSRFARQGNNLYGEWCFRKGCGIKPSQRAADASHEVAKFKRVYDSVQSYMLNLNRHDYYSDLRQVREGLRTSESPISAIALTEGLQRYSSRGDDYIAELQSMIRVNKLEERYTN
ncbi:glucosaminidase domain-containing protein [Hahella ganghwensis]|uniref:glucosaminidase domain-containing protein n=1 Tax=Hahella ganghwensis TaxID=286420 RepID=UPI000367ED25|nr:glucosaminidase domain-containing protein [Hahella ganghwensis]